MADDRRLLQTALDHAGNFRSGLAARRPGVAVTPRELADRFGSPTPERGADGIEVLDALVEAADPGLMAPAGPRFFGWVVGGSHPVGVAADWLTSTWGQNSGNYYVAPAAAIAEKTAARWLLDILRLPDDCSVGFVTGATMANFVCLAAARTELLTRLGWDVEGDGLWGAPRIRVCVGADAHATVFAALQYLGLGRDQAIRIGTDSEGRMRPEELQAALAAGDDPAIVVAQAGQINTGAIDPFPEISEICRKAGAWLHVDGAFGLWARACPDRAHLAEAVDRADSWATDGHKWLQAPYDSGFAIIRHPAAHRRAMAIEASYLPIGDDAHNPSDFVPELSRRARGFSIWALLRALGRDGIAAMVSEHCRLARKIAAQLEAEPGIEVLNEVALNQIAVGFGAGWPSEAQEQAAKEVIDHIQRENRVFVAGGRWRGRWIMRVSVTSGSITGADADLLVASVVRAWRTVAAVHTSRSLCTSHKRTASEAVA